MPVSTHTRRAVAHAKSPLLEVAVARHLWSSSRVKLDSTPTDPELAFKLGLTTHKTDVVELSGDAFPSKINYRVFNDGFSILLSPVLLNNSFDHLQLRDIKIDLPDKIRSKECLTITQFTSKDEPALLLDCITDTGALITIIVKLVEFIIQPTTTMSTDNSQDWSKISQPYGFDVRKPHMLYSLGPDYLVVLLRDGGIIGLQRDAQFNTEPVIFNDNSYLESLGQLFRPWAKQHTFHGADKDLSLKTVIDVIRYGDFLITVTINRNLRIWSISKQTLVLEEDLATFLTVGSVTSQREYLDPTPTKMLDILSTDSTQYLTIFLPFGNGVFKMFKLAQGDEFDVIDLGKKYEFAASLPDSNSIWLVGDFQLIKEGEDLVLWVLWKSNTSSFIQQIVRRDNGDEVAEWCTVHDSAITVVRSPGESCSDYYLRKFFQSGVYSKRILETALPIFQTHFLGGVQTELEGLSLFEKVTKTLSKGLQHSDHFEVILERQFQRFDSLCIEFKKHADEPLKLHLDSESGLLIVINRSEFSFVRPCSPLESLDHNKALKVDSLPGLSHVGDHLKFLSIISDFKDSLSNDVFANVRSAVLRMSNHGQSSTDAVLASIYDEHLKDKFNFVNLGKLVEELSQFENMFVLIDDLLNYQTQQVQSVVESKLTSLGVALVTETVREIVDVNNDVLFSLLILLLVLDFADKSLVNMLSDRLVKLLISYEIFRECFEVNFSTRDELELDEPAMPSSHSLFTKVLQNKFSSGVRVTKTGLVQFVSNQVVPFIQSTEFMFHICTELIKRDLSMVVYERFIKFFDKEPLFTLLKCLVLFKTNQPVKAAKYFEKHAEEISKYALTESEKQLFAPLEELTVFCNTNLGKYYLNVAILFLNNLQFDQAETFMELLGDKRTSKGFEKKYEEEMAFTYFTIAVEKLDFIRAEGALRQIQSPKKREEALSKLLHMMYRHQSIHRLTDLKSLTVDPNVDALILKQAHKSGDAKRSLWFYQVLYVHRLNCGVYRGAAEALYEFIDRNKGVESLKATIAELYSVVLNLVSTMEEDDQWLIQHGKEEDAVVSVAQLEAEAEQLK